MADNVQYIVQGAVVETTVVYAVQPTTTTYVQPTQHRTNETIPVIGLILSIIHLFGCLTLGNVLIFLCLGPALFCAIVGLITDSKKSAKTL